MVSSGNDARAAIAAALKRFTERKVIQTEKGGRVSLAPPSQRDIARMTGIPRSTLGDFLRNPAGVAARTVERMRGLLTDKRLVIRNRTPTGRVEYVDAPSWTTASLRNLPHPLNAKGHKVSFRLVSNVTDSAGRDFWSSTWIGGDADLAELAEFIPGGIGSLERVIFDVGE